MITNYAAAGFPCGFLKEEFLGSILILKIHLKILLRVFFIIIFRFLSCFANLISGRFLIEDKCNYVHKYLILASNQI